MCVDSGDGFYLCACLEGFVPDPLSRVRCTATPAPTAVPTFEPCDPTLQPSIMPTTGPTEVEPTPPPVSGPTRAPSEMPTQRPSRAPSEMPSRQPTHQPTEHACEDGSHGCDLRSTYCKKSGDAYECVCMEGFAVGHSTCTLCCHATPVPTQIPTADPTPEPTVEPTHMPTYEPCEPGVEHSCDLSSTMAVQLGYDCGCVCLEGYLANPDDPNACTATSGPTQEPSRAPTGSPTLHPCDDGTHVCDLGTTRCVAKEEPDDTTVDQSLQTPTNPTLDDAGDTVEDVALVRKKFDHYDKDSSGNLDVKEVLALAQVGKAARLAQSLANFADQVLRTGLVDRLPPSVQGS